MSENASVLQRTQLGVETTAGVATAANKQLQIATIPLKSVTPVTPVGGAGSKDDVTDYFGFEHTEAAIEGHVGYYELPYLVAGLLGGTPAAGTFILNTDTPNVPKTYTVEYGSSVRARKAAYAFIHSLGMSGNVKEVKLANCGVKAKPATEGISLTATPTKLGKTVIGPKDWTVLVGDSIGGLVALDRVFMWEWAIQNLHVPVSAGGASDGSFVATEEKKPGRSAKLVVEYDSVAAGYMNDLRASTQKFMRILCAQGGLSARVTFPFTFGANDPGDSDDTFAASFNLLPKFESGMGTSIEIVLAGM